jgi:hypothetical protein
MRSDTSSRNELEYARANGLDQLSCSANWKKRRRWRYRSTARTYFLKSVSRNSLERGTICILRVSGCECLISLASQIIPHRFPAPLRRAQLKCEQLDSLFSAPLNLYCLRLPEIISAPMQTPLTPMTLGNMRERTVLHRLVVSCLGRSSHYRSTSTSAAMPMM